MESHARFNTNGDDLLKPLRDSQSPVSLADLKTKAGLAHALAPKNKLSVMKIGGLAFISTLAATAVVLWFTSPGTTTSYHAGIAVRQSASSGSTQVTNTTYGSGEGKEILHKLVQSEREARQPWVVGLPASAPTEPANDANATPSQASKQIAPSTEAASQPAMPADSTTRTESPATENAISRVVPTRLLALQSRERLYGGIQYGTIMGSINSFGGGVSVTASSDWMQASFRYTSTFGTTSSELFFQPVGRSGDQRVSEYALLVGARLEQGDFWASVEAGPNVIHASFDTYLSFPRTDTLSNQIGGSWGASAQATFGYRFNDHLGIDLTGFVSNHTVTYGGILLSVMAGKLD